VSKKEGIGTKRDISRAPIHSSFWHKKKVSCLAN